MSTSLENVEIDPISLEIFRSRVESIAEQGALVIENTSVAPAITESKDYSATITDAEGRLIVGGGSVRMHFYGVCESVQATIRRFEGTIVPGDVFFCNEPHLGGGLHPQDVAILRPVFVDEELVAWVGVSAHMIDMGGMVMGSFAPQATECYQESIRFPPVRMFRDGHDVSEFWDVLLNNVRMADLVEMDLRGLVAGTHASARAFAELARSMGPETFNSSVRGLQVASEREMRRRIGELEDGVYRTSTWVEFHEEFYYIPCKLTITGGSMEFDYEGAAPQVNRFFNSKPYIIASEFMSFFVERFTRDLPFNGGLFAPIEFKCPPGSIVNCNKPAPNAAGHMHVAHRAADLALQAVMLAIAASPNSSLREFLVGPDGCQGIGISLFSWAQGDGQRDAYIAIDGMLVGAAAGIARDGGDLMRNTLGYEEEGAIPDIEVLESWYPLLFAERRVRNGVEGAGALRAGGGAQIRWQPHGVDEIVCTTLAETQYMPIPGLGGGLPGADTRFTVFRQDGPPERLDINSDGTVIRPGDFWEMRLPSGGGFGDPLARVPSEVAEDIRTSRFGIDEASDVYGVVLDADGNADLAATEIRRAEILKDRLARSVPPVCRPENAPPMNPSSAVPLYWGVTQCEGYAYSAESGTVLAQAPRHWSDGCAVLEVKREQPTDGQRVVTRSYLDPATGRALHVETVLEGAPRSFEMAPERWTSVGK
ncbi:hydantoinase B/oxoprolinase family protein [Rhodococcus sp. NPDC057014]|uniref:hydantoinase B/oxoprolinase family protein n=1 Tax=Rhodococcus sp. NPDC057014 TaxID=3346000 RepID=UPI00363AF12D